MLVAPLSWSRRSIKTDVKVETNIVYRYARTIVTATMENMEDDAQEISFHMTLPEVAFISNFTITENGVEYVAEVLDTKSAETKYKKIKEIGLTGGLASHKRNREFTYSVNIKEKESISFQLTYDERLERYNSSYKYQLFLQTQNELENLSVVVNIEESLPIEKIFAQPAATKENMETSTKAHFEWNQENPIEQLRLVNKLKNGLSVEYSVSEPRDEIQVLCGHFIHWFTPDKITRDKFVVFVLDVSASMIGKRIRQLKNVLEEIFDNMMSKEDYFSIIKFNQTAERVKLDQTPENKLAEKGIYSGSLKNKDKAQLLIQKIDAKEGSYTNINEALLEGIKVAAESKDLLKDKRLSHMVVFLTDGEATEGEIDRDTIIRNVQKENVEKIPILTLGFGSGSDFELLKGISAMTDSLSRLIFNDVDAVTQLENFFYKIERPTLENVKFEYIGNVQQDSLTNLYQGQMYKGGQTAVAGQTQNDQDPIIVSMKSDSRDGAVTTQTVYRPDPSFEDQ